MDHPILHHVYSSIPRASRAIPNLYLGQSDHVPLFLLPAYTQVLKWEMSSVKTAKVWSGGAETIIQNCFECNE